MPTDPPWPGRQQLSPTVAGPASPDEPTVPLEPLATGHNDSAATHVTLPIKRRKGKVTNCDNEQCDWKAVSPAARQSSQINESICNF